MFSKILIANRGEVAVRIIRACKEMGISTVAVFSEADRESLHVSLADESICIGPAPAKDSYLNMTAILSAARVTGAQAIHPGYGLLSENARFAKLCRESGIVFIGPSEEIITRMGDKDQARKTMMEAGVPVIPGTDILKNVNEAKREAARIGYPVLVKARSGGGGRGIRLVESEEQLIQAFNTASAEAKAAFGDGGLYMEKYLKPTKHIELQILCDKQGNVICLGERECSVQRKNQKLVEECPSPSISPELREQMMDAAIRAGKAVGYENAGTLEFLVDQEKRFYFMEMNTRLQVEHTVTEMVTGVDIVKWQIRIAAGASLDFTQKDVQFRGHAIEARINAEDPAQGYRPSAGTIEMLHIPGGPWVRFDSFVYQGYRIPP
ncbi:MAG: acetyl-CoA carboxylase biotin carboxylase subunit, partial [Firmicutes bacterium]|nr:acetyl-CoA carboxylase biotin carboxylase subunit [Bacillota bacterium]